MTRDEDKESGSEAAQLASLRTEVIGIKESIKSIETVISSLSNRGAWNWGAVATAIVGGLSILGGFGTALYRPIEQRISATETAIDSERRDLRLFRDQQQINTGAIEENGLKIAQHEQYAVERLARIDRFMDNYIEEDRQLQYSRGQRDAQIADLRNNVAELRTQRGQNREDIIRNQTRLEAVERRTAVEETRNDYAERQRALEDTNEMIRQKALRDVEQENKSK